MRADGLRGVRGRCAPRPPGHRLIVVEAIKILGGSRDKCKWMCGPLPPGHAPALPLRTFPLHCPATPPTTTTQPTPSPAPPPQPRRRLQHAATHGRVLMGETPLPRSAGCYVCGTARLSVQLDTAAWTLGDLVNKVIKGRMAVVEPTVNTAATTLYETGEARLMPPAPPSSPPPRGPPSRIAPPSAAGVPRACGRRGARRSVRGFERFRTRADAPTCACGSSACNGAFPAAAAGSRRGRGGQLRAPLEAAPGRAPRRGRQGRCGGRRGGCVPSGGGESEVCVCVCMCV